MNELISWSGNGGISFFLSSDSIRGFKDLVISASTKTKEEKADGEQFAKKESKGSYQITLTAILNEMLDDDIQTVALSMTEAARKGSSGYFYNGGKKLFPAKFMMTDAKISNLNMIPTGGWISCEVALTLKQCGKFDDSAVVGKKKKKNKSGSGDGTTLLERVLAESRQNADASIGYAISQKSSTTTTSISAAKAASKKALENLTNSGRVRAEGKVKVAEVK